MNALIISAVFGVIMMFTGIVVKQKPVKRTIAITGVALLLLVNILEMNGIVFFSVNTEGFMQFDRFALLFNSVAFGSTLVYFLLSARDMEKVGHYFADYVALIFFILCGVVLVSSFQSLLILFLCIEIISIPLYILTGTNKRNLKSNEASLKYLLMGAFSTGIMLMGIALIYGATGTFTTQYMNFGDGPSALAIAGMLLMFFSMAFKVSAAPFHFWTPDVYDGSPTVFTSFMATVVKAAAFIGFIRLFYDAFGSIHEDWKLVAAIIAACTLLIGNITAVFQQSVKRMLAYSSISQAGFMLLALLAFNATGKEGIILYAAAYSLATIGTFAILLKMNDHSFESFNGFARQQPLLAGTNVVFLLSLSGIPLTAGFLAKFYMLKATLDAGGFMWLVILAVIMAAVSVYYYFRLIQAMYFKEGDGNTMEVTGGFKIMLVVVAALLIILGIFPNLLLNWLYF